MNFFYFIFLLFMFLGRDWFSLPLAPAPARTLSHAGCRDVTGTGRFMYFVIGSWVWRTTYDSRISITFRHLQKYVVKMLIYFCIFNHFLPVSLLEAILWSHIIDGQILGASTISRDHQSAFKRWNVYICINRLN